MLVYLRGNYLHNKCIENKLNNGFSKEERTEKKEIKFTKSIIMVLQQFYEQKKKKIQEIINPGQTQNDTVRLFNDNVFEDTGVTYPLILFKYNNIVWNTSSEKEYKADVDFSVFVILAPSYANDYLESFELARKIDQAILLHPNKSERTKNEQDILNGVTTIPLITNSALKVREGQYTVEDDHWAKNNYYIWEINYSTTLIEKEYKKRYTMISNEFFVQNDIDEDKELVRKNLKEIGYDLDDYNEVEYNGKKLLVYKNVEEHLIVNNKDVEL